MKRFSGTAAALAMVVLVAGAVLALPPASRAPSPGFPHEKHAKLFPTCTTCHEGVVESGASVFPDATSCASCHDGTVKPRVVWTPPEGPRATNLRFSHATHATASERKNPADSALAQRCSSCHVPDGAQRMTVRHAVVGQCLSCHGIAGSHFDVDRNACKTCHVSLTEATTLTREAIAKFPRPASHNAPEFRLGSHGTEARSGGTGAGSTPIAASCATCHSRDLCLSCHVNAPESPEIRSLGLESRAPAFTGTLPVPPGHKDVNFLRTHGPSARQSTATCTTCHTRESCVTCHAGGAPPRAISRIPLAGVGRAEGAHVTRKSPQNHTASFREGHGPEANARPGTCESCHQRLTCLGCHRPDNTRRQAYHPTGFLTKHPTYAYARASNCSDCHNPAQFCQRCHQESGLAAAARVIGGSGYHDAYRGFALGHGQAARQSLESCVSCHAERDCTSCHSAVGSGYRFSPHGPGFDPGRAQAKNPSTCIACHGRAVPTR